MLQVYIQQVINQTLASMSASGEEGEDIEVDSAVATNTLQVGRGFFNLYLLLLFCWGGGGLPRGILMHCSTI